MRTMRFVRRNGIAWLALFLAVSAGGAYAAAKITGKQIAPGAIATKHVKPNAIGAGQVKAGAIDSSKVADGSLVGADVTDGSLDSNDVADASLTGSKLADSSVTARELAQAEPWRVVGQPGQPVFAAKETAVWSRFDHAHNQVAFYKDPYGVVHLKGLVKCVGTGCAGEDTIFFLPPGYRPVVREVHLSISNDGTNTIPARVNIDPDGRVGRTEIGGTKWLSLDGITFRIP